MRAVDRSRAALIASPVVARPRPASAPEASATTHNAQAIAEVLHRGFVALAVIGSPPDSTDGLGRRSPVVRASSSLRAIVHGIARAPCTRRRPECVSVRHRSLRRPAIGLDARLFALLAEPS